MVQWESDTVGAKVLDSPLNRWVTYISLRQGFYYLCTGSSHSCLSWSGNPVRISIKVPSSLRTDTWREGFHVFRGWMARNKKQKKLHSGTPPLHPKGLNNFSELHIARWHSLPYPSSFSSVHFSSLDSQTEFDLRFTVKCTLSKCCECGITWQRRWEERLLPEKSLWRTWALEEGRVESGTRMR
jgi:hypothetical protein